MTEGSSVTQDQAAAAAAEIEGFWREAGVQPELGWHFSEQASMAHPGNLGGQAQYALEQAKKVTDGARPRPAAPTPPRAPEQPAGSRPSYGNMVSQIRAAQTPRVA